MKEEDCSETLLLAAKSKDAYTRKVNEHSLRVDGEQMEAWHTTKWASVHAYVFPSISNDAILSKLEAQAAKYSDPFLLRYNAPQAHTSVEYLLICIRWYSHGLQQSTVVDSLSTLQ